MWHNRDSHNIIRTQSKCQWDLIWVFPNDHHVDLSFIENKKIEFLLWFGGPFVRRIRSRLIWCDLRSTRMEQLLEARVLLVVLVSFVHAEASSRAILLFLLAFVLLSRLSELLTFTRLSMPNFLVGGGCGWRATQLTWWLYFIHTPVWSLGGDIMFERAVWVILLR